MFKNKKIQTIAIILITIMITAIVCITGVMAETKISSNKEKAASKAAEIAQEAETAKKAEIQATIEKANKLKEDNTKHIMNLQNMCNELDANVTELKDVANEIRNNNISSAGELRKTYDNILIKNENMIERFKIIKQSDVDTSNDRGVDLIITEASHISSAIAEIEIVIQGDEKQWDLKKIGEEYDVISTVKNDLTRINDVINKNGNL